MRFGSSAHEWLKKIGLGAGNGVLPSRSKGFVYVSADDDSPLTDAKPGIEIRNATRRNPWIVVDHEIASITIAKWPGKLWSVEITDAVNSEDQKATGGPPLPGVGYTRAVAVLVDEELPIWTLFGPDGAAVCRIIEVARRLTTEQALTLSAHRHPDAGRAYDRAFRRWLTDQGLPINAWDDDFDGTLDARRGKSKSGSPIMSGLRVLHSQVCKRAKSILGDAAFITDEDENAWLVQPWQGAGRALCDAALALGAPNLIGPADRQVLTSAWGMLREDSDPRQAP